MWIPVTLVVVINADKIKLSGKKETDKMYHRHTGWVGGLVSETAEMVRSRKPEKMIEDAVWGMLPRGPLGRRMHKKLKVYAGGSHPHVAQKAGTIEGLREGRKLCRRRTFGTVPVAARNLPRGFGLSPGEGKVTINKRAMDQYFGRETLKMILQQPLELVEYKGKLDIKVNVAGGGLSGQAGAIRHGITRALMKMDGELRGKLKKAGFVTRDPRAGRA